LGDGYFQHNPIATKGEEKRERKGWELEGERIGAGGGGRGKFEW